MVQNFDLWERALCNIGLEPNSTVVNIALVAVHGGFLKAHGDIEKTCSSIQVQHSSRLNMELSSMAISQGPWPIHTRP